MIEPLPRASVKLLRATEPDRRGRRRTGMLRRRLVAPALVGLLLAATAACGDDASPTTSVKDEPPAQGAPPARPQAVVLEGKDAEKADLQLWVSNQSFIDDPVHLTVRIDGDLVVDDDFAVEGQHNFVSFPLQLPEGEHVIEVEADTGATLEKTFVTPASGDKRYALVDYWNYGEKKGRHLDWMFQKEPIYFM